MQASAGMEGAKELFENGELDEEVNPDSESGSSDDSEVDDDENDDDDDEEDNDDDIDDDNDDENENGLNNADSSIFKNLLINSKNEENDDDSDIESDGIGDDEMEMFDAKLVEIFKQRKSLKDDKRGKIGTDMKKTKKKKSGQNWTRNEIEY